MNIATRAVIGSLIVTSVLALSCASGSQHQLRATSGVARTDAPRGQTSANQPGRKKSPKNPMTSLWEKCEQGSSEACDELWSASLKNAPRSLQAAWKRACFRRAEVDLGAARSCALLAKFQVETGDTANALRSARRMCIPELPTGCTFVGKQLVAREQSLEGVMFLERACGLDEPEGCRLIGMLYGTGTAGLAKDPVKATFYFERGCSLGDPGSCGMAGRRRMVGDGVARDPGKAQILYSRGCVLGDSASCNGEGTAFYRGWGAPRDAGRAVELFRRACEAGNRDGCVNLADAYAEGEGVPADHAAAKKLYLESCERGHAAACERCVFSPIELSTEQSGFVFGKVESACWHGRAKSCVAAGVMVAIAERASIGSERLAPILERACASERDDLGGPESEAVTRQLRGLLCDHLANMYAAGDGVEQDAVRAVGLVTQACALGVAASCTKLKRTGR